MSKNIFSDILNSAIFLEADAITILNRYRNDSEKIFDDLSDCYDEYDLKSDEEKEILSQLENIVFEWFENEVERLSVNINKIKPSDLDKATKLFRIKEDFVALSNAYLCTYLYMCLSSVKPELTRQKEESVCIKRKQFSLVLVDAISTLFEDATPMTKHLLDTTTKEDCEQNNYNQSFVNKYVDAFIEYHVIEEKISQAITKPVIEEFTHIYVKRLVHMVDLSEEEVFQYVLKPNADFEYNSKFAKEIFDDAGLIYIPVNHSNLKHIAYAYFDLANYQIQKEFSKQVVLLGKCKQKVSTMLHLQQNLNSLIQVVNDTLSSYFEDYYNDYDLHDKVYETTSNISFTTECVFDFIMKETSIEARMEYEKLDTLYKKYNDLHLQNPLGHAQEQKDISEQIKVIKNKICKMAEEIANTEVSTS